MATPAGPLVWSPHRRQIAGAVTAPQPLRIPPVRLDPVAGLHRNQRRRDHLAIDSQFAQLPVQYVAGWTGFVAGPQMLHRPQFFHQLADRLSAVGDRSQAAQRAVRLGNRYSDRLGMDIQTQKSYLFLHDPFLSPWGSELYFLRKHSLTNSQLMVPFSPF